MPLNRFPRIAFMILVVSGASLISGQVRNVDEQNLPFAFSRLATSDDNIDQRIPLPVGLPLIESAWVADSPSSTDDSTIASSQRHSSDSSGDQDHHNTRSLTRAHSELNTSNGRHQVEQQGSAEARRPRSGIRRFLSHRGFNRNGRAADISATNQNSAASHASTQTSTKPNSTHASTRRNGDNRRRTGVLNRMSPFAAGLTRSPFNPLQHNNGQTR